MHSRVSALRPPACASMSAVPSSTTFSAVRQASSGAAVVVSVPAVISGAPSTDS